MNKTIHRVPFFGNHNLVYNVVIFSLSECLQFIQQLDPMKWFSEYITEIPAQKYQQNLYLLYKECAVLFFVHCRSANCTGVCNSTVFVFLFRNWNAIVFCVLSQNVLTISRLSEMGLCLQCGIWGIYIFFKPGQIFFLKQWNKLVGINITVTFLVFGTILDYAVSFVKESLIYYVFSRRKMLKFCLISKLSLKY